MCANIGLAPTLADSPFATHVLAFDPAPGQFVNDPFFDNSAAAVGRPYAGGFIDPENSSLASLGGFGGSIILGFDHPIADDPANPFGLDAIVFGNAFWQSGNPNRRWAECGVIEISRDTNGNGLPDDPWYVIVGSHLPNLAAAAATQTWDDDVLDPTWPPDDEDWIPPGHSGTWTTAGYLLPPAIFDGQPLINPNGPDAATEGIYGYADLSPTVRLGDLNGDNVVEDPNYPADVFYTRPDSPLVVGWTPGSGGGDAFDTAWAVDAQTGAPAGLDRFDFIRISTAENFVAPMFNEISTEIDAVADVAEGRFGDSENDGDIDQADLVILLDCLGGSDQTAPTCPCRVMDFDQDGDLDLGDVAAFQREFTGS